MIEFISRLPKGYQEVEYIESSGTQYINTGVIPTVDTGVKVRGHFTSVQDADNIILGASDQTAFANGKPYSIDSFPDKVYVPFGGIVPDSTDTITTTQTKNKQYEYTLNYMDSGKASVDTLQITLPTRTSMTSNALYLFCLNGNGTARYYSHFALEYLQITQGESVIHDYVPCYRKADNVAGLYDIATGTFLTNAGSGVFAVGADSNKHAIVTIIPGGVISFSAALRRRMMGQIGLLPSGYTRVDYIKGTGSQYIDTGFVVNKSDNYALEIDGLFPSQAQTYQGCNCYMQFFVSSKYGIINESSISVGNRDTVRITYANQTTTLTVNGSQADSESWTSWSGANVKLGILRIGDANNSWFSGGAASGTIYGYKVWKNNILVSECVPCVRNSDGAAGMYDVIREQFVTNAGSGAFKFPVILPFGLKYSGDAEHTINDNKHIVKLLSSGILTVNKTLNASVYLLAGGGGGIYTKSYIGGASGGGGGYQTVEVELAPGTYEIVIGAGGITSIINSGSGPYVATAPSGGDTTAFGYTSTGGGGGAIDYDAYTAGTGGTPNGGNGKTGRYNGNRNVTGGSPNGGGFTTGPSVSNREPTNVTNGGDGYVTITISI